MNKIYLSPWEPRRLHSKDGVRLKIIRPSSDMIIRYGIGTNTMFAGVWLTNSDKYQAVSYNDYHVFKEFKNEFSSFDTRELAIQSIDQYLVEKRNCILLTAEQVIKYTALL